MQHLTQIPDESISLTGSMKSLLRHWYQKRVVQCQQTTSLMEAAIDHNARRALGIVALLDVDVVTMTGLMDAEELRFVQTCHAYLDGYSDGMIGDGMIGDGMIGDGMIGG